MMRRALFKGGVHPRDAKETTRGEPIRDLPAPARVALPVGQHIGAPARPVVKKGDRVFRGQLVAEPVGPVSASVHASVSGAVAGMIRTRFPTGAAVEAVQIDNDFLDEWDPALRPRSREEAMALPPAALGAIINEAGIVGMGGATFPSHVKLAPPGGKKIEVLVVNGVECEPYLSCDHRLMLEHANELVEGILLFMHALAAPRAMVGIEDNKPDAGRAVREAAERAGCSREVTVHLLPVRYPQGAEKQLITALLGREVPSGGLPADIGVVVHNVGSVHSGYLACRFGQPSTERIVTVAGPCVARPGNWRARLGTPVADLLQAAGTDLDQIRRLLVGGPMMGLPQGDADLYVTKGMTGLLAFDTAPPSGHAPCLRCGHCLDVCPSGLVPGELSIKGERGLLLEAEAWHALDCIECGCCAYVCSGRRPIVQWIRMEKAAIQAKRRRDAAAKPAAP